MQKVLKTKLEGKRYRSEFKQSVKDSPIDSKLLEIMFLYSDDSVKVIESTVIDFNEVIEHLGKGNALFIASKNFGKDSSSKISVDSCNQFIDHL